MAGKKASARSTSPTAESVAEVVKPRNHGQKAVALVQKAQDRFLVMTQKSWDDQAMQALRAVIPSVMNTQRIVLTVSSPVELTSRIRTEIISEGKLNPDMYTLLAFSALYSHVMTPENLMGIALREAARRYLWNQLIPGWLDFCRREAVALEEAIKPRPQEEVNEDQENTDEE